MTSMIDATAPGSAGPHGRRVVALALLAALGLPSAAGAQSTESAAGSTDSLEEVVVTGYRASLSNALEIKKAETGVVDAILAEDIADFPDSNLAESLQRVPGVALARGDGGEGRQISVRGLGSGFTRVRINGIEAISTSGGSDISGGAQRGRGVDFSVFASELFNSLQVRKTSSADVEEGSLGATVDLQSARPFDYDGTTFALSAQGSYNDLREEVSPRFAGLASTKLFDDRFGVLASVAYSEREVSEEGYTAVNVLRASDDGGFCTPLGYLVQAPANTPARGSDASNCGTGVPRTSDTAAYNEVFSNVSDLPGSVPGSAAFHPRLPRYLRSATSYERLGATVSLQFLPADSTEFAFDAMYGKFDVERLDNYIAGLSFGRNVNNNGKPHTSIVQADVDDNGTWNYGLFNGVDIRSEGLFDKFDTDFQQYVLSGKHSFSDRLRLDALVGRSRSELSNPVRTTINLDIVNVNGFSFDFRGNQNLPLISYGVDINNSNNYRFGAPLADGTILGGIVGRDLSVDYQFDTAELNLAFDVIENLTVKVGGQVRENTMEFHERSFGGSTELPAGTQLSSLTRSISGFGDGLGLPSGAPTSWVAADLAKFEQALPIYSNQGIFAYGTDNPREVIEKPVTVFGMLEFSFDAFGLPFRGNAGVRYVQTELDTSGVVGVQYVTVENDYNDTLPAFNLAANVTDDVIVRLAAAKVMSRPDYTTITPGGAINTTTRTISSGNPTLAPIRAKTVDLQAEWYFAEDSLLSLGLFYKDIDSYIQSVRTVQPFNTTGLPESVLIGGGCSFTAPPFCVASPTDDFTVTRAVNTPGGPLEGLEVNYQQAFSFLTGPLSNTGLLLNYTYVTSEIEYTVGNTFGASVKDDLVGLSRNAFNATVYYDDQRLSARVSAAYRDKYLTAVPAGGPESDVQGVDPNLFVDASVSYNVSPGFRLTLEMLNLTDEFNRYFIDSTRDDTLYYSHSGRTFTFGGSYKF